MVIINMYIAVILENFSQATEDVQQGLTQVPMASILFDPYNRFFSRTYVTALIGFTISV